LEGISGVVRHFVEGAQTVDAPKFIQCHQWYFWRCCKSILLLI